MTVALVAAAGLAATSLPIHRVAGLCGVVWSVVAAPGLVVPAGVLWLITAARSRLRRRELARQTASQDLASLAELTAIGLSGGLGIQSALELAADEVGGAIGAEANDVLRRMRIDGLRAGGTMNGAGASLYRAIARAAASGSSLLDPVARIADELHADLAARRIEAVRRLPIAMLFPLTLLILPGFLLLTVAPALLEAFGRLEI